MAPARVPAIICLLGALLGLAFAWVSTTDYAAHLDRQVHDLHCSIVPGLAADAADPGGGAEQAAETGCRAAMYSAYSALMRDRIWGGVPIGLFALGAFSFFAAFAAYVALAGDRVPRHALTFLGITSLSPLAVSIFMAVISALEVGSFCKTCIGIYVASVIVAAGGVACWVRGRNVTTTHNPPSSLRMMHLVTWLCVLAAFVFTPALVYARSVPNYSAKVKGCGTLESADDPEKALLHFTPRGAVQPVVMVVDPLCPTCKAFHTRLVAEGIFERLDTTLVLFPLDSECNWNLSTPLHPGACAVARAVLCGDERALSVLEYSYAEQEELASTAKQQDGETKVLDMMDARFPGTKACAEEKKTRARLDEMMRFAVRNKLEVSTPQLFVGSGRLCDEDSDIGLSYALHVLAPALRSKP